MTNSKDALYTELSSINHDRARWFALILLIFSLILIIADPFISDLSIPIFKYLLSFHIFLFISSLSYLIYFWLSKTKKYGTRASLFYSIAILFNSTIVSGIFDTILERGIIVYLLTVLVIGFSVYINKVVALVLYILSFTLFLICLINFQKDSNILTGNIINSSLFTIVSLFLIISNRNKKIRELTQRDIIKEQKQNIEEKNHFLEEFNQQLLKQNKEIIQQKEEITSQRDCIQYQNNQITSSIKYAKSIQSSILPSINEFQKYFSNSFVLFKPKEIVSGDFYWLTKKNDNIIFCIADCTGHGVPGAFMSLLGISFLSEITNNSKELNPSEILNQLRLHIIQSLKQNEPLSDNYDGLDISFCILNTKTLVCRYSGAHNSLYIIRKQNDFNTDDLIQLSNYQIIESTENLMIELKSDKMPVSVNIRMDSFNNQTIKLFSNDIIYLCTDGYADQLSDKIGKKFMYKNLKKLLLENCQLPMQEQKKILEKTLVESIGDGEQIDDITIVGIRI